MNKVMRTCKSHYPGNEIKKQKQAATQNQEKALEELKRETNQAKEDDGSSQNDKEARESKRGLPKSLKTQRRA